MFLTFFCGQKSWTNLYFIRTLRTSTFFFKFHMNLKKYPQLGYQKNVDKVVDKVDNYSSIKCSPIRTTSPAPIVINMSPLVQFSLTNFSICSKVGK